MAALPNAMGSTMKLYFKATGLKDADVLSKSDPYCVLHSLGEGSMQGAATTACTGGRVSADMLGRTETKKDELSPEWQKTIDVPFLFEAKQDFRVSILDDDGSGVAKDDALGTVDFTLSSVVCSRNMTKTFPLQPRGSITITAKEVKGLRDNVTIQFRGSKMKQMDTFSASDCYFKLDRLITASQMKRVHKSEVIDDNNDPKWKEVTLPFPDLTGADTAEKGLLFRCLDKDLTGGESMGSFTCSYDDLVAAYTNKTPFKLVDEKQETFGDIYVERLILQHTPTFAEYLQSGWQINLAVSIDFTGSNGDPRQPNSLHFMNPQSPNQYVSAIMGVGDILIQYDTDKQVAGFGFGAAINGQTHHFFHLNQQPNPYLPGVQGLLNAYGAFLPTCSLSGPTNFAPTILSVTAGARQQEASNTNCYTVLLIITDGAITDLNQTIDAIVAADDAPLSIVIVGVGNADFSSMEALDGDDGALYSNAHKRRCRRDLVQFVAFRDYAAKGREALARSVLKEVPGQFEKYTNMKGFKPLM